MLKPGTVQDWMHLAFQFNTKFSKLKPSSSSSSLAVHDIDVYLRTFHRKALDCCDPMDEEMLVDVWLHDTTEEYMVLLENSSFPSFSKLMELVRRTNKWVHKSLKFNSSARCSQALAARLGQKKRQYSRALTMPKGHSTRKDQPSRERNRKKIQFYSLPLRCEETAALLEQMSGRSSCSSSLHLKFSFHTRTKACNYCPYHRRRGHTLE